MDPWKLAVVVRDDLAVWQKLNVTAFVVSGLGTAHPQLIGDHYLDGDGRPYLPMFAIPTLVYGADTAGVRRAFDRAHDRGVPTSVYTVDLFATMNDIDNRAAVATVPTAELDVVGFALAGERRTVDKVLGRLTLHA